MGGQGGARPRRKRIRLDGELYAQPGTQAFLTIAVRERRPVFLDHALAHDCVAILKAQADLDQMSVIAYCFMPEHIHILVQTEGTDSIIDFVRDFKGKTMRCSWRHQFDGMLWQQRFHDHLVRESEDSLKYVRYILQNPCRKGLVDYWRDYPFSGSFAMMLEDDSIFDPL